MTKPTDYLNHFVSDDVIVAYDIEEGDDGGPYFDVHVFTEEGVEITDELTNRELAIYVEEAEEVAREVYEDDKLFVLYGI